MSLAIISILIGLIAFVILTYEFILEKISNKHYILISISVIFIMIAFDKLVTCERKKIKAYQTINQHQGNAISTTNDEYITFR